MKIVVADQLASSVIEAIKHRGDLIIDSSLKGDSLLQVLREFKPEILVVRSTKVTAEHIQNTPSLSLIIRAGAGVNTIALETASEHGVFVANCPGKNAIAVAELVMGHILNIDRNLYDNIKDFREGLWNKKKYSKADGLYGKTIAILGMGAIGKEVSLRVKSFGIKVKAWDIALDSEKAEKLGVTYCPTPLDATSGADILTVHLPSTPDTKNILNYELLSSLRKGATVINTSRGALLEETYLQDLSEIYNLKFDS